MSIYNKIGEIEERVCRKCKKTTHCWGKNYDTTKDVFNKAANIILKNLKFEEKDIPAYFMDTCIHTDRIYTEIKDICENNKYEIMAQRAAQANRKIMGAQYESLSAYIKDICLEIAAISELDENTAEKIKEYFSLQGAKKQDIAVYYDAHKAIHIEAKLCYSGRFFERKVTTELSDILGKNIVCESNVIEDNFQIMKFTERERFFITVAQTNRSKEGERVCGDSFSAFKAKNYRQVLALADGMGSGPQADRLSNITLDILKSLLENGFSEEKACSLINSTLLLGGDGQSFSTLDMASINLFNGNADFYKLGAAPTLILRGGRAYEIFCASLPAGIMGDSKAEHRNCKLKDGDMIIMLSDGVDIDQKMLEICRDNAKESPITLCERIMEKATVDGKSDDDITVAIAKINLKKSA